MVRSSQNLENGLKNSQNWLDVDMKMTAVGLDENKYSRSITHWYDNIMEAGYYDHDGAADALVKILGTRKKILELGIGTGLLAQRMIQRGYEVSGIDFTKSMLDIARKRLGKKVKLYEQNVIRLDLPETYEAAVSEGGVWIVTKDSEGRIFLESYITDLKHNILGMKNVADHLSDKGLLILNTQPVHRDWELKLRDDAAYSQKVRYHGNFIDKEYFVKQKGKTVAYQQCRFRRFAEPEKKKIMKVAGFVEIGLEKSNRFLIFEKSKL